MKSARTAPAAISILRVDDAQPAFEDPQHVGARDRAAEERQVRFRLVGVEEAAERIAKLRVAEVVETGSARRLGEEPGLVEASDRQAERSQHAADGVDRAHAERLWRRRQRRGRGH
jgi:hypothetical protein